MSAEAKSHARPMIVAEILATLESASRPLTLGDLYARCGTVETKADLARVLTYLKSEGKIENGDDVQPGEPGGMAEGKGARAVASYRLVGEPVAAARREIADEERAKSEALRAAYPDVAETFDRVEALEDPSDIDPDHNPEDVAFRHEPARIADMRCDAGMSEDRAALLIHGAEELLISIARERLRGDPVWDLANAHYQALMEVL